jgi:hypothetical protein
VLKNGHTLLSLLMQIPKRLANIAVVEPGRCISPIAHVALTPNASAVLPLKALPINLAACAGAGQFSGYSPTG